VRGLGRAWIISLARERLGIAGGGPGKPGIQKIVDKS